jgi:hypothetical protein
VNYSCIYGKDKQFIWYYTINFVEKNIEGITQEEVDSYNLAMGKLFRWLNLALKTRKEDIIRRKTKEKVAKEEIERQTGFFEQREQKRE